MTTATPSTALATIQPAFTDAERFALAGFLAGYRGLTREAYALDLRQFASWCRARSVALFAVRRADIEGFARDLEARGRARATVTRRLSTIAGFYKYAVQEELLDRSPAAHVRRPRIDYESHAVALDRNELGALLVAAGLGPPAGHALISLLALNGLRVSEATGADIEHLGLERGHRTLTVTRKGGKVVTVPLAPRTARAIDLAVGERTEGPVFLAADGRRLDRHGAGRIVRRTARRAGITKNVTPHTLRHAFITAAQRRGVASDATFRGWREGGVAGPAALPGVRRACGRAAGHAVDQGFLAAGCGGCQDVASESVALDDRWLHLASRVEGAVWGQCGGRWRWWLPVARCRFRPVPRCWRRCWPGGAVSSRRAG
jgi:site-specific recombinase XerD